uniref:Uncharacterized protein n=1 Tax=Arundo donax TaxID=35708 RepID=A0A0A9HDD3_ARUDO
MKVSRAAVIELQPVGIDGLKGGSVDVALVVALVKSNKKWLPPFRIVTCLKITNNKGFHACSHGPTGTLVNRGCS